MSKSTPKPTARHHTTPHIVGIIPARFASTRFPGKMLHPLHGKPLLQHVWERASKAKLLDCVIIATDDMRIAEAAFNFGAEVALTKSTHPSGTDRIAEVASKLRGITHVINIQGDEPTLPSTLINRIARTLASDPTREIVTAARPLNPATENPADPNLVKVATSHTGRALYFSRAPIPCRRDKTPHAGPPDHLVHLGIYGYRIATLLALVRLKPSPLEKIEKLEQLRALEHGYPIQVLRTSHHSIGIDTPEDTAQFETSRLANRSLGRQ